MIQIDRDITAFGGAFQAERLRVDMAGEVAGEGERPQWANEFAQIVEIEQGGVTYKVPPSVKQRLDAPLSAAQARAVLHRTDRA